MNKKNRNQKEESKYVKKRMEENAIKLRDWEKNSLFGLATHKHILW